jgi:hypothetical protein
MPIGRSQIPKQIEGKLNKLAVQLGKSAKLHSKQAKVVKGIIRGSKKGNRKKA